MVVNGFRFTTIGLGLNTLTGFGATKNAPIILDVTEFDKAIEFAESKEVKERECLAKDKSALKGTLEALKHFPNIIVIMTGNTSLDTLQADSRSCYVNEGAIDLCKQV
jgi:hypothetical protein